MSTTPDQGEQLASNTALPLRARGDTPTSGGAVASTSVWTGAPEGETTSTAEAAQPNGVSSYQDVVQEDERMFMEAIPRSGQLTTATAPVDDASAIDAVTIEGGVEPSSGQFSTAEESAADTNDADYDLFVEGGEDFAPPPEGTKKIGIPPIAEVREKDKHWFVELMEEDEKDKKAAAKTKPKAKAKINKGGSLEEKEAPKSPEASSAEGDATFEVKISVNKKKQFF